MYASSVMDQKAPRRLLVLLMWPVAGGPDTGIRADEDIHQRSRVPSPSVDGQCGCSGVAASAEPQSAVLHKLESANGGGGEVLVSNPVVDEGLVGRHQTILVFAPITACES